MCVQAGLIHACIDPARLTNIGPYKYCCSLLCLPLTCIGPRGVLVGLGMTWLGCGANRDPRLHESWDW